MQISIEIKVSFYASISVLSQHSFSPTAGGCEWEFQGPSRSQWNDRDGYLGDREASSQRKMRSAPSAWLT